MLNKKSISNVVDLSPWMIHEFAWGTAIKKQNGKWTHIFIGEQELDVERIDVHLDEKGIVFL